MSKNIKWQDTLSESAKLFDRGTAAKKKAGELLWKGAIAAIESHDATADPSAEVLWNEIVEVTGRKPDASKIKAVAVAVATTGLDLAEFSNLSRAYAEAIRRTKTVKVEADEDDAADKAVESILGSAPKTTSKPEGAALILLAEGVDTAVDLLLDALGKENGEAHRAFLRAVANGVAARKPKPEPKPKAPAKSKKGATKATTKAAPKAAPAKAKPTIKEKADAAKAAKADAPMLEFSESEAPIKGEKAKPVIKAKVKPVIKAKPKK